MRPAPTPISGLAATMTSVSFQPLTKPMQKPHTKVVKRCRKMATWSAMASLILLMSLRTQTLSYDFEPPCQPWGRRPLLLRHASVELPHRGAVEPADLHPHHFAEVHPPDELDLPGGCRHPHGDLSICAERHSQGVWHTSVQLDHGQFFGFCPTL